MTDPPPILGVVGGAHSTVVAYDHARELADTYDAAGSRMREWGARGGEVLASPDLLESALLAPLRFAEAELAVLAATTGPDGILVESVVWEADAITIRVRVRATELTDELVATAWARLDYEVGRAVGFTLTATAPEWLLPAVLAGAVLGLVWASLPPATRTEWQGLTRREAEEWLLEHPEVVQHAVNAGGGLIDGLWDGLTPLVPGGPLGVPLFTPDAESAAGLLAGLYDEGQPRTVPTGLTVADSTTAPADLPSLLRHLSQVNDLSDPGHPERNGTLEVQTMVALDGSRRHVVYLPGTDDLGTTPWSQDGDARDMGANLRLVSGQQTTYEQGVLQAMGQAGIRPGEPVLLVGHSQGGMVAASLLARVGGPEAPPFGITQVVTAGSPTAQVEAFPAGSRVLSLENRGDVVPLLDGADNADSAEQVTVRFDDRDASVAGSHGLGHYLSGATAVEASGDPALVAALASLHEAGFLGSEGQDVTSQVFQVTRV